MQYYKHTREENSRVVPDQNKRWSSPQNHRGLSSATRKTFKDRRQNNRGWKK